MDFSNEQPCHVATRGGEKSDFVTQLLITKDGKKLSHMKGHRLGEILKEKYPTTDMVIVVGGIIPKGQPLDKLINSVFKGTPKVSIISANCSVGCKSIGNNPGSLVKRSREICCFKSYATC
eukprot:11501091-Ditylum_brightwellii.AAC.1